MKRSPRGPGLAHPAAQVTSPKDLLRVLRDALERTGGSCLGGRERQRPSRRERVDVRHLAEIVGDAEFLREAHLLILRRPPDLESWLAMRRLLSLGFPRNLIVSQLAGSAEARDRGWTFEGVWIPRTVDQILALDGRAFIREAFRSVLWREPDTASLKTYEDQRSRGRPRREILREIAISTEAQLLPRATADLKALVGDDHALSEASQDSELAFLSAPGEELVRGAYRAVLRRDPEPAGLAHWLLEMAQGLRGADLLRQLLEGPEARAVAIQQPEMAQIHARLRWAADNSPPRPRRGAAVDAGARPVAPKR